MARSIRGKLKYGDRVELIAGQGQMREFIGRKGRIIDIENYGGSSETLFRVELDSPVYIDGIGRVQDDLWAACFMHRIAE